MRVRLNSKLIDAAPNVVRLPTAQTRQVRQNYNQAAWNARAALRKASPWPGEYVHPQQRDARKLAEQLQGVEQTPALIIASAILASLDADAHAKVVAQLAPGALSGRTAMVQALATARASRLNVGQQLDLFNALDRLNERDR